MWTEITRLQYELSSLRYASDPRSEPGAGFERFRMGPDRPCMPPPKTLRRPRTTPLRDVVNAILYLLRSGCPWRLLLPTPKPGSFSPAYNSSSVGWQDYEKQCLISGRMPSATFRSNDGHGPKSVGQSDSPRGSLGNSVPDTFSTKARNSNCSARRGPELPHAFWYSPSTETGRLHVTYSTLPCRS